MTATRDAKLSRSIPRSHALAKGARHWFGAVAHSYDFVTRLRNRAYDRGILRTHRVGVPVVAVGNLTVGGTGKTPVVEWFARQLLDRELRVCLLSRGYKAPRGPDGKIAGLNDEGLLLACNLPGVPHLQGADRVAGAQRAIAEFAAQALVMDDGFQHRRLHRDLNVLLLDATNPFGGDRLLPAGDLRERATGLRRADAMLITRSNVLDADGTAALQRRIVALRGNAPPAPILRLQFRPQELIDSDGIGHPLGNLRGVPAALVSGIGNPQSFERTARDLGANVAAHRIFGDHFAYDEAVLVELENWAAQARADCVLTTQKDLVKLRRRTLGGKPLWAVRIAVDFIDSPTPLIELLDRALQAH